MNKTAFDQLTNSSERAHWRKQKANWIRLSAMRMTNHTRLGHTGGDLASADILAVLYLGGILNLDPTQARWPQRETDSLCRKAIVRAHFIPCSLRVDSSPSNN